LLGGILVVFCGIFLFAGYTILIRKKPLSFPSFVSFLPKKDYTKDVKRLIDIDGTEIPFNITWGGDVSKVVASGIITEQGIQTNTATGKPYIALVIPIGDPFPSLHAFFAKDIPVLLYKAPRGRLGETQRFEATSLNSLSLRILPNTHVLLKIDMNYNTFLAYGPQIFSKHQTDIGPVVEITFADIPKP